MSDDKQMIKISSYVSKHFYHRLKTLAGERKISLVRLVSIAVDNEFQKEMPFEFDSDIPTEEYIEYAFANEAGRILTYMKSFRYGAGLDILLLLRHDMAVPDRDTFLLAFRELLEKQMVKAYKPIDKKYIVYPEGYMHYKVRGTDTSKQARKKSTRYEQYQKMKKEFGDE